MSSGWTIDLMLYECERARQLPFSLSIVFQLSAQFHRDTHIRTLFRASARLFWILNFILIVSCLRVLHGWRGDLLVDSSKPTERCFLGTSVFVLRANVFDLSNVTNRVLFSMIFCLLNYRRASCALIQKQLEIWTHISSTTQLINNG